MGSINRKFIKNKNIDIKLSMRFICDFCNFEKNIPREVMEAIPSNKFADNEIFICPKCKIRMKPISVEADF